MKSCGICGDTFFWRMVERCLHIWTSVLCWKTAPAASSGLFFFTVTVTTSSPMAVLVQSACKRLNLGESSEGGHCPEPSRGGFRQIPLRCRWSGTSKELNPVASWPLPFDVLTSLVQPTERSLCFLQTLSLLPWNIYKNWAASPLSVCLNKGKSDALKQRTPQV